MLQTLSARVSTFGEYSVSFDEVDGNQICVLRTWDCNAFLEFCVHAEQTGQRVHAVEFSALSRLMTITPASRLSLSIRGGSPTLLRVISDNREDGRLFASCREFIHEVFLRYFARLTRRFSALSRRQRWSFSCCCD